MNVITMEYNKLYDESPYVSEEIPRRGTKMTIIRATALICATVLTSVFALIFYGYQQDEFLVNTSGQFVSIFDRKHKTLNICDKFSCQQITPNFSSSFPQESRPVLQGGQAMNVPQPTPPIPLGMPYNFQNGQRMPGVYPLPQQGMMMPPPMNGANPQMINPQMMGSGANPMMMGNPNMMRQPMGYPNMNPGMMVNPQVAAGMQPGMAPMMQPAIRPQLVNAVPAPAAPLPLAPAAPPPAADTADNEPEDGTTADDAAATDEGPAEEAAPV